MHAAAGEHATARPREYPQRFLSRRFLSDMFLSERLARAAAGDAQAEVAAQKAATSAAAWSSGPSGKQRRRLGSMRVVFFIVV